MFWDHSVLHLDPYGCCVSAGLPGRICVRLQKSPISQENHHHMGERRSTSHCYHVLSRALDSKSDNVHRYDLCLVLCNCCLQVLDPDVGGVWRRGGVSETLCAGPVSD
uniref:Uncharacterized protein n=1 Tax=Anguilla anguilla TaxID=7936 RepID=A0A0E9WJQ4_ANGAN